MGLFKLHSQQCKHRQDKVVSDRCPCVWWGSFRGTRESLAKWAGRELKNKKEAGEALDELRAMVRAGHYRPIPVKKKWRGRPEVMMCPAWFGFAPGHGDPINLSDWM